MKYIARITWEATSDVRIDAANEDLALEKAMALGLPWRTAIEGDDSHHSITIEPLIDGKIDDLPPSNCKPTTAANSPSESEGTIETVDITPAGCKTPQGVKRVNAAIEKCQDVNAEFFRKLDGILDTVTAEEFIGLLVKRGEMSAEDAAEECQQVQRLREARRDCDEELLRAIANRPPAGRSRN